MKSGEGASYQSNLCRRGYDRSRRLLALLTVCCAGACQEPTQIRLEIATNIPACKDVTLTAIAAGRPDDVGQRAFSAETSKCEPATGKIGSLVLVPSDGDGDALGVQAVTALGQMTLGSCKDNGYKVLAGQAGGCIIQRRQVRFAPHTPLTLPITMDAACVDVPCDPATTCVGGTCVSRDVPDPASCPLPGGCGAATGGAALDRCVSQFECAQGLVCKSFGGEKRCTPACPTVGANPLCPAGTRCEGISGSKYCAPSDIGKPCTSGTNCNYACLVAQNYCTGNCTTAADCPNGWGCMPVGGERICVKAAATCDGVDNSKCVVPAACDLSPALIVGSCTLACTDPSDCPQRALGMSPWTCDGLCRRPSGDGTAVYGPLEGGTTPPQWACNGLGQVVNVCGDGQHVDFNTFMIPEPPVVDCSSNTTTKGLPGDACVDSCRYVGGCPFGYTCAAVGSIGASNRIGLCLPSFGSAKIGALCTRHADCFFGYCNLTKGKCSRDCSWDGFCPTGSSCVRGGGPDVESLPFRRCE